MLSSDRMGAEFEVAPQLAEDAQVAAPPHAREDLPEGADDAARRYGERARCDRFDHRRARRIELQDRIVACHRLPPLDRLRHRARRSHAGARGQHSRWPCADGAPSSRYRLLCHLPLRIAEEHAPLDSHITTDGALR